MKKMTFALNEFFGGTKEKVAFSKNSNLFLTMSILRRFRANLF